MKLSELFKRAPKNVLFFLAASPLLFGGSAVKPKPAGEGAGEPVSGLQMTIFADVAMTIETPKFRVELRNVGQNDVVANLGTMLGNGQRQYPNAVVLFLTDAQGKTRRLDLREPFFIAGRVDPFVVPIPVGTAFSIPVDLDKYWAAESKEFDYKLKPGSYSLEAQFNGRSVSQQESNLDMKGIALMPYWTGTVTSNSIRFEAAKN